MFGSLQVRINLISILFAAFVAAALTSIGAYFIHQQFSENAVKRAELAAAELNAQLDRLIALGLEPDEIVGFEEQCKRVVAKDSHIYSASVMAPDGDVLFSSGAHTPRLPQQQGKVPRRFSDDSFLYVSAPVLIEDDKLAAHVVVLVENRLVNDSTWKVVGYFSFAAALLIAMSLIAHFFFLRQAVINPLAELVSAVDAVNPENFSLLPPLAHQGGNELRALANAFSGLLQRLSDARNELLTQNQKLEAIVKERTRQLQEANCALTDDIERRKVLEEELRTLANTDPLTGLPNRGFVMPYLAQQLEICRRQGSSMAVMIFDFDGFKSINDTLGHAAGDQALCIMSDRIRQACRQSDVLARLGGDEFILIVQGITHQAGLEAFAGKLLALFDSPLHLDTGQTRLGVSIGGAIFPKDGMDVETLLAVADNAMYRIKQRGGGFALAA